MRIAYTSEDLFVEKEGEYQLCTCYASLQGLFMCVCYGPPHSTAFSLFASVVQI